MMTTIGNYSLCMAVMTAMVTLLVSLAAVRFDSEGIRRIARLGIYVLAGLFTLSSVALMYALVNSDFTVNYVAHYTEKALPIGYKLAAFWAGQEGSLLLWGWMLSAMAVIFVLQHRKRTESQYVTAIGVLALVIGFFASLMLFAANPFELSPKPVADGHGLNPMLQHPAMIAHPPVLFLGYAGFTLPFALLIGSLLSRRNDNAWIIQSRGWVLVSWLFLGVGILLGSWWAYLELGWGGYWAWDPVENASLLPWLTGTALLHSIIGQKHRGMFKRWNATLAAGTFLLCIFGTYITRSGVVQSVHSFGESLVGTFFMAFLFLSVLACIGILIWRWASLRPEKALESMVSREGGFLAASILLVVMMALTLVGTMMPAFSKMSVQQPFYNKTVLPLALILVALMAVAPMLTYGKMVTQKLVRGMAFPLILAGLAVIVLAIMGIYNLWALASAVVGVILAGSIVMDWINGFSGTARQGNGILRTLAINQRRYGAHIVHAGIGLIVVGVAGSSLYNTNKTLQLSPGQSAQVGPYQLRLESLQERRDVNYSAVEAVVTMTSASGATTELRPQRRFYDKAEQPSSEVALRSNWKEDLYVTLAGWEDGGKVTALQVIVNPLVSWIWAGGLVLTLGGLVCLLPRLSTGPVPVEATEPVAARRNVRRARVAVGAAS